ncbi:MAG: FAD-binding oxidoreductase [Myxococcota bacterium]
MNVAFAVVGAGLAGAAVIESLLRHGVGASEILWIDKTGVGGGASGAPGAMLNPLAGRSLQMKSGEEQAFTYAYEWIRTRPNAASFCRALPVLRPLIPGFGARQMSRSYQRNRTSLPTFLQAQQYSSTQMRTLFPQITENQGGLLFSPALCVAFEGLIRSVAHSVLKCGVTFVGETHLRTFHPHASERGWYVQCSSHSFRTQHLILAPGAGITEVFPHLPLQITGGELMLAQPPLSRTMDVMISAGGYIIPISSEQWVMGATHRHGKHQPEHSSTQVVQTLLEKAAALMPELQHAKPLKTWFGARAIYSPDRMPLVGEVPGYPNLYVCTAMSSKGLLWSPWSAESLVQEILCRQRKVPDSIRVERTEPKHWQRP